MVEQVLLHLFAAPHLGHIDDRDQEPFVVAVAVFQLLHLEDQPTGTAGLCVAMFNS